jgi:hypothetical protein
MPCVVHDGTVRVIDRRATPTQLVLEHVEATVSGATRDRPIDVDLTAGSPGRRTRRCGRRRLGPVPDLEACRTPLDAALALRHRRGDGEGRRRRSTRPGRPSRRPRVSRRALYRGQGLESFDATPARRWRRYLAAVTSPCGNHARGSARGALPSDPPAAVGRRRRPRACSTTASRRRSTCGSPAKQSRRVAGACRAGRRAQAAEVREARCCRPRPHPAIDDLHHGVRAARTRNVRFAG